MFFCHNHSCGTALTNINDNGKKKNLKDKVGGMLILSRPPEDPKVNEGCERVLRPSAGMAPANSRLVDPSRTDSFFALPSFPC